MSSKSEDFTRAMIINAMWKSELAFLNNKTVGRRTYTKSVIASTNVTVCN